ncbi:hypothetical protein [Streptomyces antimycoticus]
MDIVTSDGNAHGSHYVRTKVGLFHRTRHGRPDVVFSAQNNETSWDVEAGIAAPSERRLIPQSTLAS